MKICDFGLAAQLTKEKSQRRTKDAGTSHWMAPELVKGERYGVKTDVWSLGIFLMEMANGKPPFFNEMIQSEINYRVINEATPPLNEGFSPDFQNFVNLCLFKNP